MICKLTFMHVRYCQNEPRGTSLIKILQKTQKVTCVCIRIE